MKSFNSLYVKDRDEWRKWLSQNHNKESAVWLIFYKTHTGKPSLPYGDAVEEALCYGWIDSIIKRIDDEKYARKFTLRKEESKWSVLNAHRAEKMIRQGKMTEKGLKLYTYAKENDLILAEDSEKKKIPDIPGFIMKALERNQKANEHFISLAPSYKRQYIGWIMDAKKEETKMRRLDEMIGLLAEGKKLGLK